MSLGEIETDATPDQVAAALAVGLGRIYRRLRQVKADSSSTAPERAVRTRHNMAPNPCARLSARSAKSAADWPDTSRTATRSV